MAYFKARLKEQSTWVGLSAFISSGHYWFTSLQFEEIIALFMGLTGLITMFLPEK